MSTTPAMMGTISVTATETTTKKTPVMVVFPIVAMAIVIVSQRIDAMIVMINAMAIGRKKVAFYKFFTNWLLSRDALKIVNYKPHNQS